MVLIILIEGTSPDRDARVVAWNKLAFPKDKTK